MSDIYSVAEGEFVGDNLSLQEDITLIESDPYGRGWLYEVRGTPEPQSVDAHGYATVLDAIIDKMLEGRHEQKSDE